jgi:hypothetical protein
MSNLSEYELNLLADKIADRIVSKIRQVPGGIGGRKKSTHELLESNFSRAEVAEQLNMSARNVDRYLSLGSSTKGRFGHLSVLPSRACRKDTDN